MKVVLDTSVVSKLCHPTNKKNRAFVESLVPILEAGKIEVFIPEIADYELRRKMIQMSEKDKSWDVSLKRLDKLKDTLSYLSVDTDVFHQAAKNWATAKNSGKQLAPDDALDGDSILAAQAISVGGKVVTENQKHLALFCEVMQPQAFIDQATKLIIAG